MKSRLTQAGFDSVPIGGPGLEEKMREIYEALKAKMHAPAEAIAALRGYKQPKFDQSVEVVCSLGIDPKQADQQVRGSVSMPKGTGKTARVICFCGDDKVAAAKEAGALEAGGAELVEKVNGGWMDFDVAIASPDQMRVVSPLGRVLGPRGLMPNPKAGTVTTDLASAIKEFKAGKLEFRADRTGIVHVRFGKASFSADALLQNLKTLQETIDRNKPSGAKGRYWKSLYVTSTMGPSVEVDFSALQDIEQGS